MKKWSGLLLTVILAVSITACGSKTKENGDTTAANTTPTNTTKTDNSATNQTENKETLPTLEELINQSTKTNNELKSYHLDMSTAQNVIVEQGEQKQEQKVTVNLNGEYIQDPLKIHVTTTQDNAGQKQEIEQYVSKDGMYVRQGDTWQYSKDASVDEMVEKSKKSSEIGDQLQQFKTISDQTKITVEGDNYIVSADVSGNEVKTIAKGLMAENAGVNEEQLNQMLDMMNITELKLTTKIQKETYYLISSDVKLVMNMEQNGQKMSMDIDVNASFDKHDAVSEIVIPQEVLDSAKQ